MSDEKKRPSHRAYAVENFSVGDEEKANWAEIGAAWPHKDGKGLDLNLKLMPLNGRVVLRENKDVS